MRDRQPSRSASSKSARKRPVVSDRDIVIASDGLQLKPLSKNSKERLETSLVIGSDPFGLPPITAVRMREPVDETTLLALQSLEKEMEEAEAEVEAEDDGDDALDETKSKKDTSVDTRSSASFFGPMEQSASNRQKNASLDDSVKNSRQKSATLGDEVEEKEEKLDSEPAVAPTVMCEILIGHWERLVIADHLTGTSKRRLTKSQQEMLPRDGETCMQYIQRVRDPEARVAFVRAVMLLLRDFKYIK